jgi:hypothetical protein
MLDAVVYADLLGTIRQRIRTAQYEALRAVNTRLVALHWNIGQLIVERQHVEGVGTGCDRAAFDRSSS